MKPHASTDAFPTPSLPGARGRRARSDRPAAPGPRHGEARNRAARYRNPPDGTSPSKAATAKVGQDLQALYAEYQAHLKETSRQGAAAPAFKSSNAIALVAGGSVVIDATASGDPEALATDLRALGAENVTVFGRMVSGGLPITAIPALQDLSSLQFARPAYATTNVEDVGR
jgi:hypothetical protein